MVYHSRVLSLINDGPEVETSVDSTIQTAQPSGVDGQEEAYQKTSTQFKHEIETCNSETTKQ
ncbi:hypothetical protein TSUD_259570 [Trifolium subterraneum]|uniref:Uncharacterized protein n=1 Tax=Trifolium subterraneum TaxID=3900 RepID=A0A2Z6MKK6_TRISU|nr:hypothetical protein TSUD_259570 [Trifolium subterraneum]